MATIRASCTECGDVELTTRDVQVRICDDNNVGTYSFRCPHCLLMVVKSAESRTIDLLVASGVAFTTWRLPVELFEPRLGDPISHDDLLDFHKFMENDAQLEKALDYYSNL